MNTKGFGKHEITVICTNDSEGKTMIGPRSESAFAAGRRVGKTNLTELLLEKRVLEEVPVLIKPKFERMPFYRRLYPKMKGKL